VEHHVGLGDEIAEIAARQVERDELEALPVARVVEVAQLLCAAVVVVEAVDPDDLLPLAKQRLGQIRADETGAAGD
jgi:hypothetical protein